MRRVLILISLGWLGCTSPLTISTDDASAGGGDGGVGGGGMMSSSDLAPAGPDLGGAGATCTTACDCQPGLACVMGACTASMIGMLYCCESATCPTGSYCQSMAGKFQMCGGGGIGGFDAGVHLHDGGGQHPHDGGPNGGGGGGGGGATDGG